MEKTFQQLCFADISHKLPPDCWAYWRNEKHNGEFEDEAVLYCKGNTLIDHLDLDDASHLDGAAGMEHVFMIVVEGDLEVSSYIFNEDTDGATGLIVLGNLTAGNIVAGGQEIYVTGNLSVNGLFWGDYNHGDLTVTGNASAAVFMETEEYHVKIGGERIFGKYINDEVDEDALESTLDSECLISGPDGIIIWREKMLEFFQQNKSVILQNEDAGVPFVFESREFNNANLQRLRESPVFLKYTAADADGVQRLEYWRGDDFKRVVVIKDTPFSERLYLQQYSKAILIQYVRQQQGLADKLLARTPRYDVSIRIRTIVDGEEPAWYYYSPELPEHRPFMEMGEKLWDSLLTEWSEIEHWQNQFAATVTPEKISHILQLPVVVKKYGDYYDDEAEALWHGSFNWQFRPGSAEKPPRITIVKEQAEGEGHFEFYHYEPAPASGEAVKAVLLTQDGDGYEQATYHVPVADAAKYRRAFRYFRMLEEQIAIINDEFTG